MITLTPEYKFLQFLHDEGIYEQYKHNCMNHSFLPATMGWKMKFMNANNFLWNAFLFKTTPEGLDYWHDMVKKWRRTL